MLCRAGFHYMFFKKCSCLMQVGVVSDYDLLALDSISGIS